jgi:hypothetical protein
MTLVSRLTLAFVTAFAAGAAVLPAAAWFFVHAALHGEADADSIRKV